MTPTITSGLEIEGLLYGEDRFLRNDAPKILNDPELEEPQNKGRLSKEGSHAMIEIHGALDGAKTSRKLYEDTLVSLALLERLSKKHGLTYVPMSEVGAGKRKINQDTPRLKFYEKILPPKKNNVLSTVCGTHIHYSIVPEKELEQMKLLMALEPLSYAITSTSPILYNGQNSLNNHRVHFLRKTIFGDFQHAQIQQYPQTLDELMAQQKLGFAEFMERSGASKEEMNEIGFYEDNTGYLAIRRRPNIGKTGTLELRMLDTGTLDNLMGAESFFKGILLHGLYSSPEIVEADMRGKDKMYDFTSERIILPDLATREYMQNKIFHLGSKQEIIKNSLAHLLPYAKEGLAEEDKIFLLPIEVMAESGINPAHEIMQAMRSKGYRRHNFSPQQVTTGIEFMRRKHELSLNVANAYLQ